MTIEVKCLTIEFFIKSHLIISTATEEKIHRFCNVVFSYENGDRTSEIASIDDYQKELEYIKQNILKAVAVIKKESDVSLQSELQKSMAEIEAAPTGNEILTLVENISAKTR